MLVLSRKTGETITIGDNADIKIVLLETNGNSAKIGIAAPKTIPVHREEIYERIHAQKVLEDKNKENRDRDDE